MTAKSEENRGPFFSFLTMHFSANSIGFLIVYLFIKCHPSVYLKSSKWPNLETHGFLLTDDSFSFQILQEFTFIENKDTFAI